MKFAVALICALISGTVVLGDFLDDFASIMSIPKESVTKCFEESGLTMDEIEQEMNDASDPEDHVTIHKIGCFVHCVGEKSGLAAGTKIKMTMVHQLLDPYIVKDFKTSVMEKHRDIEYCGKLVRHMKDECELTVNFLQCLQLALDKNQIKGTLMLKP